MNNNLKNIIATLLAIMVLIVVPSGFAQVHKYIQDTQDVRHLAFDLSTYLAKKGTLDPTNVSVIVSAFLTKEIQEKALSLDLGKLSVNVVRVNGFSDQELTAYDSFKVIVDYPKPRLIEWLNQVPNLHEEIINTIEPVPHYKEVP